MASDDAVARLVFRLRFLNLFDASEAVVLEHAAALIEAGAALAAAAEATRSAAENDGKTIPDGTIVCSSGNPLTKGDVRELWLMRAYLVARRALKGWDRAVAALGEE